MSMKKIAFSADEWQIARARAVARREGRKLGDAFREWLNEYGSKRATPEQIEALFDRLKYANSGRKFTRDEMNER